MSSVGAARFRARSVSLRWGSSRLCERMISRACGQRCFRYFQSFSVKDPSTMMWVYWGRSSPLSLVARESTFLR